MNSISVQCRRRNPVVGLAIFFGLGALLSACTVVKISDDKAQRELHSDAFDAAHYVKQIWQTRVMPSYGPSSSDVAKLLPAISTDLDGTGKQYGRQAGIDAPWTFIVQGDGVISAVDRQSRAGTVTVSIQTSKGPQNIELQAGPVLSGSSIRDSQAYLSFNDFSNQIAYAKVSSEMNRQALAATMSEMATVKVGDRVRFAGAFSVSDAAEAVRIVPVSIQAVR